MNQVTQSLKDFIASQGGDPSWMTWELSTRPEIADLSSNVAFRLASVMKQAPQKIAERLAEVARNNAGYGSKFSAENGFLNRKYSDSEIASALGRWKAKPKKLRTKLMVDFGGPNVAKPMHVGHLRSLVIGDALAKMGTAFYEQVWTDIHLGDWGYQMGLLLASHEEGEVDLTTATAEELAAAYAAASAKEDESFKAKAHQKVLDLQRRDPATIAVWERMVETTKASVDDDLERLNIRFKFYNGESHSQDAIPVMLSMLDTREDDGALVVGNDDPPTILRNRHGGYLYAATDLATLAMRQEYQHIIYVTDQRQHFHFERVFEQGEKLVDAKMEHVGFGTVNGADGKPFKTRSGGVPALSDLLDEAVKAVRSHNEDLDDATINIIAMGCIKFGDLQNKRTKSYNFDIARFCEPTGKTGAYIQYQAVRANRVSDFWSTDRDVHSIAQGPEARKLAVLLTRDASVLTEAFEAKMPHIYAQYLYEVASEFSSFYAAGEIKNDEERKRLARYTYEVLSKGLAFLGIQTPREM